MKPYYGHIPDEKIQKIAKVLANKHLGSNKKLETADSILPIPPDCSSYDLAEWLDVSHSAIVRTPWWRERQQQKKDYLAEDKYKRMQRYEGVKT